MTLFNINRFHLFAMTFWLLAKFLTVQMMFPIFSNYVPKWRCTATQKFGNNCTLYEECVDGVEFENNYFQSAGKFHSDIFNFICPLSTGIWLDMRVRRLLANFLRATPIFWHDCRHFDIWQLLRRVRTQNSRNCRCGYCDSCFLVFGLVSWNHIESGRKLFKMT